MMNKKEITQFAKKILHSQQGLQNRQLMHPKREWLTGVVVALSIFIASLSWSALEYVKYQNLENQTLSQLEAPAAVYRETLVAEALSVYTEKADRLNTLLGADVSIIRGDTSAGEAVNREESSTKQSADFDAASTTQATSSSSDAQATAENEEPTETETPLEDSPQNESPAAPIEEGLIQPAMNI
jgi:hypothetical protein